MTSAMLSRGPQFGNVFGWTADRTTSFAVLDAFVAAGGRAVDTPIVLRDRLSGDEPLPLLG